MARPSNAVAALKKHATKTELEQRKNAEKSLETNEPIHERPETRKSTIAHKEFVRLRRLLRSVDKDNALYEPIINRYCILQAECAEFETIRNMFVKQLAQVEEDDDLEPEKRYRLQSNMQKSILDADKQVQAKRKMMFDIERECAMTIASAMRSIPKTPTEQKNPLAEILNGKD